VIAPVIMASAGRAFFFDVRDFAAAGHLAVLAQNAPAWERREAEKSNETHCFDCLSAISGPMF
jgi:hypothetical protein